MTTPWPAEAPRPVLVMGVRETLPLVVRLAPSAFPLRAAWRLALYLLVVLVPVAVFVGVTADPLAGVMVLALAAISLVVVPELVVKVKRGPVLGADKAGVWIRPLAAPHALFLPWTSVAGVYVRRTNGHECLCVRPLDPAVDAAFVPSWGGGLDRKAGAAIDNKIRYQRLGTNVFVPLTGADVATPELLRELTWYSAGRCPVGG